MFPNSQQNNELFFQISSTTPYQQNTIPQDLIMAHASMDGGNLSNTKSPQRKLLFSNKDKNTIDCHTKRVMHRDTERQRRQEMATLCTSLRKLLPIEYIKVHIAFSPFSFVSAYYSIMTKNQKLMISLSFLSFSLSGVTISAVLYT